MQPGPQMPAMQVPPVQNQPKHWYGNKAFQIIVILALIIIGGVMAKNYYKKNGGPSKDNSKSVAPFGIKSISSGWPAGIPDDFLLSEGEVVTEKFETQTETTRQAVLRYETPKSNIEVFGQYKPWMEKKGYALRSNSKSGEMLTFSFTKGPKVWIITISPSQKTQGKNLVDFTFEEPVLKQ